MLTCPLAVGATEGARVPVGQRGDCRVGLPGVRGLDAGRTRTASKEPDRPATANEWDWLKEINDQYGEEIKELATTTGGRFR